MPYASLIEIYKTTIQPKIDYAITIWGYSSEENVNKIQRLQNRAIRAILNNYDYINYRGVDLVASIKLLNVKQRRDYFMSLLIFKCIHGLAPDYLCNEITMAIEVTTRNSRFINSNDVYVPITNTECVKKSFSYRGPVVWNALPDDLKECANLNTFKYKVRDYFLSKLY